MAGKSNIEWTGHVWNPLAGCSVLTPGCTHCYAMKMAGRIEAMGQYLYAGLTKASKAGAVWTGVMRQAPEHVLLAPLKRKKPTTYFVNSMSDLFHENVPDEWIDRVFAVMALAPQHTFQILTKRAKRMRDYCLTLGRHHEIDSVSLAMKQIHADHGFGASGAFYSMGSIGWHFKNIWLGVSTERQQEADERIPLLLQTPGAIRFISAEPLLGPIDLTRDGNLRGRRFNRRGEDITPGLVPGSNVKLDWTIVGGESGPYARPMHPDWARDLRDQCLAAGVPFFFKQWGEYLPVGQSLPGCGNIHGATSVKPGRMKLHYGGTPQQSPKHAFAERGVEFASTADGRLTFRVGKKAAGRVLDGIEYSEMPEVER